jgi:hypothetical protein
MIIGFIFPEMLSGSSKDNVSVSRGNTLDAASDARER